MQVHDESLNNQVVIKLIASQYYIFDIICHKERTVMLQQNNCFCAF
jgi:hypothetical protein